VSDLLAFLLLAASGGVLLTFMALRTRGIRPKTWLFFSALVAAAEAILCAVVWRDSMGIEEPLQSAIPFLVGFSNAFLVGLAVFFARHRSIAFRVGTAAAVTVLAAACSPVFVLFLGCAIGPCI
jgi:drug/metabolite transporter (DMT)-like permease